MASSKRLFLLLCLLILFTCITCSKRNRGLYKQIEDINKRSLKLYGPAPIQSEFMKLDESILYPGTNKHKLSILAAQWRSYYSCTAKALRTLTPYKQLPSNMLAVYEGTVARLHCSVCIAPSESGLVKWMVAKELSKPTFRDVEASDRHISEKSLYIYNTMSEDQGVYQCCIGGSYGGIVVLEVVAEDDFTVVKPQSSQGPYPSPKLHKHGLVLFSRWQPWSECSTLGTVGRRHRYGMCYVKLDKITRGTDKNISDVIDDSIIELFEAFPKGIPCRSQHLPTEISKLDVVQQRKNEIMIGLCKINDDLIFAVRTSGSLLESANNELEAKQPSLPARQTMFVDVGQPVTIKCPGTTLRDVPISWRIGTKQLIGPVGSRGTHVSVNPHGRLVLTTVRYQDTNLYSCWQGDKLAGTLRVLVCRSHVYSEHHITLFAMVLAALLVLSCLNKPLLRSLIHNNAYLYFNK